MGDVGRAPTIRELISGASKLIEFGHDPVNGSWQVPPDPADVHQAGALLVAALALLDDAEREWVIPNYTDRRLVPDPAPRGDAESRLEQKRPDLGAQFGSTGEYKDHTGNLIDCEVLDD